MTEQPAFLGRCHATRDRHRFQIPGIDAAGGRQCLRLDAEQTGFMEIPIEVHTQYQHHQTQHGNDRRTGPEQDFHPERANVAYSHRRLPR